MLIADLKDLEKLDASEINPRRIYAKEVLISQKGDQFIFPVADGTAKLSGRDYEFRKPTPRREQTVRSEDYSGELEEGEPGESPPAESTDDDEARADFLSIQGDFINRHHNEPRVQLNVPKEETFPIPLEYIDVTRSTHTDLDVMQEKRADDCWNVDSNRSLSDSLKGFTKFTLLEEKPLKGYIWSVERLTKVQTTTRPDYVWPGVWTKIGKAAQNREKHKWAREKPKLDNAGRLRGIYFIDPDDQDYKETLKHVRRKLEILWQQPCRARGKLKLAPRRWRGGWGFQGTPSTSGGPARVPNLRVCKHPCDVLSWYRLVGVVSTSSGTHRREDRAARKGKWSPRAAGTTVLTCSCPTASRVSVAARGYAR